MTTHYIDITLLPDPEFGQAHLLGALMAKLHRVLVQLRADDIGVSFPRYSLHPRSLGDLLRLHGSPAALQGLMTQPWLQGMRDHVRITALAPAPSDVPHRAMRRRQFKTNVERLRRRRMKRKNETAEQAATAIPDGIERVSELPYVQLRSASTGQPFCLFIEQGAKQIGAVPGPFNSYGLSLGATVPWF
jgi:CRISPR-associated endonuclease Csy4